MTVLEHLVPWSWSLFFHFPSAKLTNPNPSLFLHLPPTSLSYQPLKSAEVGWALWPQYMTNTVFMLTRPFDGHVCHANKGITTPGEFTPLRRGGGKDNMDGCYPRMNRSSMGQTRSLRWFWIYWPFISLSRWGSMGHDHKKKKPHTPYCKGAAAKSAGGGETDKHSPRL